MPRRRQLPLRATNQPWHCRLEDVDAKGVLPSRNNRHSSRLAVAGPPDAPGRTRDGQQRRGQC